MNVWVRDHSHHTPAHMARVVGDGTYRTACGRTVSGGLRLSRHEAISQQVMLCTNCFQLPLPVISPRFGEVA